MTGKIPHRRTSERRDFKRCQQRWYWAWRRGLKTRSTRPDALWFGTGIHLALQHRYSKPGMERGTNVLKVWRDYVGDERASIPTISGNLYESEEAVWVDAKELGEAMLGAYLDFYGKDERWYVISAEQTFEIPIPRPLSPETLLYYNGTFDLVARDLSGQESLWVWDHKTAKVVQTHHLSLDDQAGSYWAVAGDVLAAQGLVPQGERLDGILYNFLRKAKPDARPRNREGLATNKPTRQHYIDALTSAGAIVPRSALVADLATMAEQWDLEVLGEPSKVQPSPNFLREEVWRTSEERKTQIRKIQAEGLQMEALQAGLLPLTKNPTKDCAFDCSFFQMCELHEQGSDWKEFQKHAFIRLDPYADHRKSTDA